MEQDPYYPSPLPPEWEEELLRRVAATLVWGGDYTYEQLLEEYKYQPSDECEENICTVEATVHMLWIALINDMEKGTRQ